MEAAATATAGNKLIGTKKPHLADTTFKISLYASGGIVVLVLAAILLIMFNGGRAAFETFGLGFIWSAEWNPVTGVYGALPAITGTIITTSPPSKPAPCARRRANVRPARGWRASQRSKSALKT